MWSFLFLIPMTSFAVANFSGHWVADSGTVSSNIGLNSKCSKVEIIIEQTEKTILTKKYQADCALYGTKWGPIPDDYENGKVFEDGVEVGTVSDTTLMTLTRSGSAQYAYNLKLSQAATGEWQLQSYYGTKTAAGAMATEATLRKVP